MKRIFLTLITAASLGLGLSSAEAQAVSSMSDRELTRAMALSGDHNFSAKNIKAMRDLFADGYFDPRDNSFNSGNMPHDLTTRRNLLARSRRNAEERARAAKSTWYSEGPCDLTIYDEESGEYRRVHVNDLQFRAHYETEDDGSTKLVDEHTPRRVQLMNGHWLSIH
jgi:hypothetical protein